MGAWGLKHFRGCNLPNIFIFKTFSASMASESLYAEEYFYYGLAVAKAPFPSLWCYSAYIPVQTNWVITCAFVFTRVDGTY